MFTSLIPISDFKLKLNKQNKLSVKESYILLIWFNYYVKNKNNKFGLFVQPIRKKIIGLVRSPMASKTWSFEHFLTMFYKISFTYMIKHDAVKAITLNGLSEIIYLLVTTKMLIYIPETSFFHIKLFVYKNYFKSVKFFKV